MCPHCCALRSMARFVRAPLKTAMQSKVAEHHALNKRFPWKVHLFSAMYIQWHAAKENAEQWHDYFCLAYRHRMKSFCRTNHLYSFLPNFVVTKSKTKWCNLLVWDIKGLFDLAALAELVQAAQPLRRRFVAITAHETLLSVVLAQCGMSSQLSQHSPRTKGERPVPYDSLSTCHAWVVSASAGLIEDTSSESTRCKTDKQSWSRCEMFRSEQNALSYTIGPGQKAWPKITIKTCQSRIT